MIMCISNRLKELRATLGMSQRKFATRINISGQAIAKYETDVLRPSDRAIADICREYHVSERWLRTGEGEMFASDSKREILANLINEALADEAESFRMDLLITLAKLSPQQWQVLKEVADLLKKQQDQEKS